MNNDMERTVTAIIGTTSEEESHWGRLIVLAPSGWMCENVLPIFLNAATVLNILKPEITRSDLMANHCMIRRKRATHEAAGSGLKANLSLKNPMKPNEANILWHRDGLLSLI